MNLLDIGRSPLAGVPGAGRPSERGGDEAGRLQGLLARIGAEIAGPLTAAVERINTLASTGTIDSDSLRQLRDEVQAARQAGIIGQQLTRFSAGRIRQSHERLQLADAVSHVLAHRQRQTRARGVTFLPSLTPVEVVCDASLLASLLDSMLDWALGHATSEVELTIEVKPGPAPALLRCRFSAPRADAPVDGLATTEAIPSSGT